MQGAGSSPCWLRRHAREERHVLNEKADAVSGIRLNQRLVFCGLNVLTLLVELPSERCGQDFALVAIFETGDECGEAFGDFGPYPDADF